MSPVTDRESLERSEMSVEQLRRFGDHMNPYWQFGGDGYKRDKAWQEGWDAAVTLAAVAWLPDGLASEPPKP